MDTKRRKLSKNSAQYKRYQQKIVRLQAELDALQTELCGISFSGERQAELEESVRALQESLPEKRSRCEELTASLPRCHFNYQPPEPGFDRNRVLGPVCRLFEINDPDNCTALATIAGERLFDVVVDSDETIQLLREHGQVDESITFVTVGEGGGPVLLSQLVREAQEIGGGPENVVLALDLVSYDESLRPNMASLFGAALVCRDLDVASRVSYHPRVQCRTITQRGDECHPEGTITGGVPVEEAPILIQLTELKQLEKDIRSDEAQLSQLTAELNAMQDAGKRYATLQQRCEEKSNELDTMKTQLASSN